jgi:putative membrane protein
MKKLILTLMAVALFGFISAANAAPSDATAGFIKGATIGGKFEIKTSKLALEKSNDADIKAFANQMIKDHGKADKEMKSILTSDQAAVVPKKLDEKHQTQFDALKKATGADFDKQYIDAQVAAHGEAVSLFEDYSKNGDDAKLKDFATKTLPTLKGHQDHINMLQSKKQ